MDLNFPISTPEAQGIPSSAIQSYIEELERERIEIHSLIIMRNNHIVFEGYWSPFGKGIPHRVFSAGKAVVSTAILFAIQEGLLNLDDKLIDLLPESAPENPSEYLKKLNVYHLLTMNTGHAEDGFAKMLQPGTDRARLFFELPLVYEPGTHFLYNNVVPDMLGIILYKVTGQGVYDYLRPRLFEPLQMRDMKVEKNGELDELPTMVFRTRDLFKLAVLYANYGKWDGKQILDEKLTRDAGSYLVPSLQDPEPRHVAYDTRFGYGYQIWRNSVGGFRLDGGRGQFGIVIPDMNLVVGINANDFDQGLIPVLFWKHVTNKLYATPIAENPEAYEALEKKRASLTWAPKGAAISEHANNYSGMYAFKETFCGCSKVEFSFKDRTLSMTTDFDGVEQSLELECGDGRWTECPALFLVPEIEGGSRVRLDIVTGADPREAKASAIWVEPNILQVHFRSNGWMGANIFTFTFSENGLTAALENGTSYNMRSRSDITPAEFRNAIISRPGVIQKASKI